IKLYLLIIISIACPLISCVQTETHTVYDSFPCRVYSPALHTAITQQIQEAHQASKTNPDDPAPHYFLGKAYWMQGDLKSAEEEFLILTQLSPDSPGAYYELARIYAATERDELALSQLKIAVELAPDSVEIHYAVAKVYEKLGDYVSASQHVEKYSKLRGKRKENRSDQKK
ncbi:MAG: tetratricopeptide repeat protein, partial [Planctomycetota bacterium]